MSKYTNIRSLLKSLDGAEGIGPSIARLSAVIDFCEVKDIDIDLSRLEDAIYENQSLEEGSGSQPTKALSGAIEGVLKEANRLLKDPVLEAYAEMKSDERVKDRSNMEAIRKCIDSKDYVGALVHIAPLFDTKPSGVIEANEFDVLNSYISDIEDVQLRNVVGTRIANARSQSMGVDELWDLVADLTALKTLQDFLWDMGLWNETDLSPGAMEDVSRHLFFTGFQAPLEKALDGVVGTLKNHGVEVDGESVKAILNLLEEHLTELEGLWTPAKDIFIPALRALGRVVFVLQVCGKREDLEAIQSDLKGDILGFILNIEGSGSEWDTYWSNIRKLYTLEMRVSNMKGSRARYTKVISKLKADSGLLATSEGSELIRELSENIEDEIKGLSDLHDLIEKGERMVSLFDSATLNKEISKQINSFIDMKSQLDIGKVEDVHAFRNALNAIISDLGGSYFVERERLYNDIKKLINEIKDIRARGVIVSDEYDEILDSDGYREIEGEKPVRLSVMLNIISRLKAILKEAKHGLEREKQSVMKEAYDDLLVWYGRVKERYAVEEFEERLFALEEDLSQDSIDQIRREIENYIKGLKPEIKVEITDAEISSDNSGFNLTLQVSNTGGACVDGGRLMVGDISIEIGALKPGEMTILTAENAVPMGDKWDVRVSYIFGDKEMGADFQFDVGESGIEEAVEEGSSPKSAHEDRKGAGLVDGSGMEGRTLQKGVVAEEIHGKNCVVCRGEIRGAEAFYCPYCGSPYHERCARDVGWCPVCGKEFTFMATEAGEGGDAGGGEDSDGNGGGDGEGIFCPYCGGRVEKGHKTCPKCGGDLSIIQ